MKKVLTAIIICAALTITSVAVFAGGGLLSPGGSSVTAGNGLGFKVNLSEIGEEMGNYTITIKISPAPEKVSVKENVNVSMNQVNGTYTVSSADLSELSALNFTVYPDSSITTETTYTVSATVSGDGGSMDDSFDFTAIPAEQPEPEPEPEPQPGPNKKPNMKGNGSFSGGTDSSLVYKGSYDNYLSALSVSGYDFTENFNKIRDTYFVEVKKGVSSLSVSATPCDSSAKVRIAGDSDVSEDMSKIQINVTADNGDVRVYRIYVTHKSEDD